MTFHIYTFLLASTGMVEKCLDDVQHSAVLTGIVLGPEWNLSYQVVCASSTVFIMLCVICKSLTFHIYIILLATTEMLADA